MNKTLKDMLIGVILGDAHLLQKNFLAEQDKAFISFEQSSKKIRICYFFLKI